jgi:hypothetical protein
LNTDTFVSSVTVVVSDIISTTKIFPPTSTVTEEVTTTDIVSQCTNVAAASTYSQAVANYAAQYTGEFKTGTEESCCQLCFETVNCVSYFFSNVCFLYVAAPEFAEGSISPECPYGLIANSEAINDGDLEEVYDVVKLGPCGTP